MQIYIMRHGVTDFNRLGRIQGASDIPLNAEGIEMTRRTAKGLSGAGIRFDRIYTSPYQRAQRTAEIMNADSGAEILRDPRIREMSFGRYEGTDYEILKLKDENLANCFLAPELYVPDPTAESYADLLARVSDFLRGEMIPLERDSEMQTVLVVCHGAVIRAFLSIIRDLPLSEFWNRTQPNCSVNLIECRNGSFEIIKERMIFSER